MAMGSFLDEVEKRLGAQARKAPGGVWKYPAPNAVFTFNQVNPPSAYASKSAEQGAQERNVDIRYPKSNELFVDIDNARDYARFKVQVEMLRRVYGVKGWTESPSASGGQHRHIVVTLVTSVTDRDRIMLQALLGSDLKRELLSLERCMCGEANPVVFFEPKPGSKPVAKKTGFNCKCCNERNDFAEANQDDGTYVCFNCRIED